MKTYIHGSIEVIPAQQWNALAGSDPFLRHEFLAALERHGCVGAELGWLPQHVAVYEGGQLIGAAPMYAKYNSYGEFVFDWSWAHAYERAGAQYYPKLVVAVPYTPATGARLLLADTPDREAIAGALIEAAIAHTQDTGASSLHWLFTNAEDTRRLEDHGLLRRTGCQFHWTNRDYTDFADFMGAFSAQKRKKINRERRRVRESGVVLETLTGSEASDEQWRIMHHFYSNTFDTKGGIATLTLPFFQEIARTMGEQIMLVMARHQDRYVAGAISYRSDDSLYGRHWGCLEEFNSLHFEACYYQGLDYALAEGLRRFEPGAQGEHKISRGFLPTPTWSAHWIAEPRFRTAIADFLQGERRGMDAYIESLYDHSPFRADS